MATDQKKQELQKLADEYSKIDRDKLLRPTLGEMSLEKELSPLLSAIQDKLSFTLEFASLVPNSAVDSVKEIYANILNLLRLQIGRNPSEYVAQRDDVIKNVKGFMEQLLQHWHFFVSSAVESRGFLKDEGVKRAYEKAVGEMKSESAKAMSLLREEATKALKDAKEYADQIEAKARRTAAHISVEEAQNQFDKAQKADLRQAVMWAVLSALSLLGFFGVAISYLFHEMPKEWTWQVIYHTAIRLSIIGAVGAMATFSLRNLRAYLHMRQQNLHRQRIANSMSAFVESALSPDQRDAILAHLVDSVSEFGDSGLITQDDESIHMSKTIVDTVANNMKKE